MQAHSTMLRMISICAAAAITALLVFSSPAAAARPGQRYAKRNANQGSGGITLVTNGGSAFVPKPKPIYPTGTPLIGGKPLPKRLPGIGIYLPLQLPPPPGTVTLPACLGSRAAGSAHWHFTPISTPGSPL